MRAVDLEPSAGEPPVILYDTSGPYTDPTSRIDIMAGLSEFRRSWIRDRGDVEEVSQREVRPEDNGQLGPDRSGGVQPFPNVRKRVLRAKSGANVTQMHYARRGIVTPEMEFIAIRENLKRDEMLRTLPESVTRQHPGQSFGAAFSGKVKMVFQSITILVILIYVNYLKLLTDNGYVQPATWFRDFCIWATVLVTIISGLLYFRRISYPV
jgi:phosphomethylpyrimidine synthase